MPVFAVEQAAGKRLVDILKPVAADDIRVGQSRAQIGRVGWAAFFLDGNIKEARPE